ncbi:MAG: XRE family transcriptional regulator [Oxalobacteraceae bacterium]|nr:MAG: XRE family transcriptional regulator [Oxalobacteraceae bacterium]
MKKSPSEPDPIDLHVGGALRRRREALGITQSTLSRAIGVTFQQLQKYEQGQNRIAASRLYAACQRLDLPVSDLFPPLATSDAPALSVAPPTRGAAILALFEGLSGSRRRLALLLLRELSQNEAESVEIEA